MGEVHDAHYNSSGVYVKKVNRTHAYWTMDEYNKAIWFARGYWFIGDMTEGITTAVRLLSMFAPICPETAETMWKYWDGKVFQQALIDHARIFEWSEGEVFLSKLGKLLNPRNIGVGISVFSLW